MDAVIEQPGGPSMRYVCMCRVSRGFNMGRFCVGDKMRQFTHSS